MFERARAPRSEGQTSPTTQASDRVHGITILQYCRDNTARRPENRAARGAGQQLSTDRCGVPHTFKYRACLRRLKEVCIYNPLAFTTLVVATIAYMYVVATHARTQGRYVTILAVLKLRPPPARVLF